jgi:hypothetical protein
MRRNTRAIGGSGAIRGDQRCSLGDSRSDSEHIAVDCPSWRKLDPDFL